MARVIVFGISQWAQLAHFYLTHDSRHEVVAFTVDGKYMDRPDFLGLPVTAFEEVEKLSSRSVSHVHTHELQEDEPCSGGKI